jgi:PAT family beta-lactamase induction signal transducer AmpG
MKKYLSQRQFLILFFGFYSGLPLALTASTLTAWLSDAGVDRAAIGLFAAVATPYAFKFLWSPLVDAVRLPVLGRLGRRRSWLLLTQVLLSVAIAAMAVVHPGIDPALTALAAVSVATLSATQDIAIDAYRVESLETEEQGTGSAMATFGYRMAMLLSGAGALALAQYHGWEATYFIMAAIMATSVMVTLIAPEPVRIGGEDKPARGVAGFLRQSVIAPFADFMTRKHWLAVLAFVVLYKLGDAFMGVMFNPFLLDLGFEKIQIAAVVKSYGLIATIAGGFLGGWLVAHWGTYRSLMVCGFGHMLTNLMLVVQAELGNDLHFLTVSITLENLTGGMATTAFIAYLSALCKTHYTATQYALLSSFAAFGRTWLSTPSGALAKEVGWAHFFAIASFMAIPGLILLWWLERKQKRDVLASSGTAAT